MGDSDKWSPRSSPLAGSPHRWPSHTHNVVIETPRKLGPAAQGAREGSKAPGGRSQTPPAPATKTARGGDAGGVAGGRTPLPSSKPLAAARHKVKIRPADDPVIPPHLYRARSLYQQPLRFAEARVQTDVCKVVKSLGHKPVGISFPRGSPPTSPPPCQKPQTTNKPNPQTQLNKDSSRATPSLRSPHLFTGWPFLSRHLLT